MEIGKKYMFEQYLKENPFDYETRRVYADWLEEQLNYKESELQRTIAEIIDKGRTFTYEVFPTNWYVITYDNNSVHINQNETIYIHEKEYVWTLEYCLHFIGKNPRWKELNKQERAGVWRTFAKVSATPSPAQEVKEAKPHVGAPSGS